MIEVSNLSKTFKTNTAKKNSLLKPNWVMVQAVKEISFTCRPGRIFSLLGPNGAGKTTTLRILSTILNPSSGMVTINGHNVVNEPIEVKKNIGFLTGSTGLYGRLTVNELMDYFGKLYQLDKTFLEKRKKDLYNQLGIQHFSHRKIAELSTGMKQKVSVCRTLLHDPEVVIFDEPTAGLDVITTEGIIELIRNCKAQNKTVIFSTHNMSEVELLCDDIAIMHKGQIVYNGIFNDFKQKISPKSLTAGFMDIVNQYEQTH